MIAEETNKEVQNEIKAAQPSRIIREQSKTSNQAPGDYTCVAIENHSEDGHPSSIIKSSLSINQIIGRNDETEDRSQNIQQPDITTSSSSNEITSQNASNGYDHKSTDDTVAEVYGNLLKEYKLLIFIKEFILEFLRKLKKYLRIRSKSEHPELGNVQELLDYLDTITDSIMRANNLTSSGLNVVTKATYKAAVNKINKYYYRRKSRKICKIFSHNIDNKARKLELRRGLLVITIIACDICRMYQQQINYISDSNDTLDLLVFVKDCVERITKSIHYRQGRFGRLSKFSDMCFGKKRVYDPLERIRNYRSTEADQSNQKLEFAKYIIYGLWKCADRKIVRRLVSGRQLYVRIKESQLAKISCNNLLDRVYVKINDKLYYPNLKDGCIKHTIGKSPVRLIDHHQDNISKRCGYRLTSLIIATQDHKFHEDPIPISEESLPRNCKILSNIVNFEGLEKLSLLLFDYFKINEKLDEYQENLIEG